MTLARSHALGLILVVLLHAIPALAEPCVSSAGCERELTLSTGKRLPLYGSFPLSANAEVERVVIVIHGTNRNADDYFERLVSAAATEQALEDTLLLAPRFAREEEAAPDEHYWSSGGWKIGHKSLDSDRFSSFAAMDELIARTCSTAEFPKLRDFVLVGHSAGAQFVNRYLAGGVGCPDPRVEVRYVVMNPSSYIYASPERRLESGEFDVPTDCSDYDEYKYGLQDLNSYMSRVGEERIRSNLFSRPTQYLAGEQDTEIGSYLDTSCRGNAQGAQRLARHENYWRHAQSFPQWVGSSFARVPGVGHSSSGMLRSEQGRIAVFGHSQPARLAPPVLLDD